MRFRLSTLLSLGMASVAGFMLFQTSQDVQQAEQKLRNLNAQVSKEREAMRVLEAEWDYLNRPDRLEELARQHLKMSPVDPAVLVRDSSVLPDFITPLIPSRKPDVAVRRVSTGGGNVASSSSSASAASGTSPSPKSPASSSPASEQFDTLLNRLVTTNETEGGQ